MSKNRVSTTMVAGLVCALVGGLAAATAEARPFQVFKTSQNCSNRSLCNLPLASIPAGQNLEVRNVSCRYLIGTQSVETLEASFDVLNQFGQVAFSESVVPVVLGRSGVGTFFSLSQPTTFFVPAGSSLRARVATDAISSMLVSCSVAGNLTP